MEEESRFITSTKTLTDSEVENKLRPVSFDEYVGQEKVKDNMRVYVIVGNKTTLAYCRDKNNWWGTELRDGLQPKPLKDEVVSLADICKFQSPKVSVFEPYELKWSNVEVKNNKITLPQFTRSIVVKLQK